MDPQGCPSPQTSRAIDVPCREAAVSGDVDGVGADEKTMTGLTLEQVDRELDLPRSCDALIASYWHIFDKRGGYVPFTPKRAQQKISEAFDHARERGRQARIKVLKFRQAGVSSYASARVQHATQAYRGFVGLSIADKEDLPAQWLRRSKGWWRETPKDFQPHLAASNRMELYFDRLGSRYFIGSQLGQTPGMGYTIRALHASEMGSWANPAGILDDLLPAIPKDDPYAFVIYESTGETVGGWWYNAWDLTKKGGDDFECVFLPWTLQEEYRMEDISDLIDLDDEEQMLLRCGVEKEQLAWRRWTIRNEFENDLDRFRCKYPFTEEEAWMDVGRLAIRPEILRRHAQLVKPPVAKVRLTRVDDYIRVENWDEPNDHWELWYAPEELDDYTLAGDVAEGKLSDPDNPRSETDLSAAVVLNRHRVRVDATWKGRIDPDRFGHELLKAAIWYNKAWATPEVNAVGLAALTALKGYEKLFQRHGDPSKIKDVPLSWYGWKTLPGNRETMIDDWIRACRREVHTGWEDKIVHHSAELLDEERNFIKTKTGRREHRSGAHDDLLFAAMIAWQLHLKCPMPEGRYPDHEKHLVRTARSDIRYSGGVDHFDPVDEPDEQEDWPDLDAVESGATIL